MIGIPLNDYDCLAPITQIVAELVELGPPWLLELAERYPTAESLHDYIRSLPQRDDDGDPDDGPRVRECAPPQRLLIPSLAPNCVERSALSMAVREVHDPHPVRQLATIDTPLGKHTFPVENGAPIVLDPRLPSDCLDCATAALVGRPAAIAPRDAIAWTAQLAETGATERNRRKTRNGRKPVRLRNVEDLLLSLIDGDVRDIDEDAAEEIAWLLATAEKIAERYGPHGVAVVRATADALRDIAEERATHADRATRNIALFGIDIPEIRISQGPVSALARVAARYGMKAGVTALRIKLATMGIDDSVIGDVEHELNKEGLTLGELAPKSAKPAATSAKPTAVVPPRVSRALEPLPSEVL